MKILSLDTSGTVVSVAYLENDIIIGEFSLNCKKKHSQTLLPMIDIIVDMAEIDIKCIDAIAISYGPGSFTGLRIGSSTAKGIGLALQKPIIEIPTMEAMAFQLYRSRGLICPIMDARRQQVYNGIYLFNKDSFETIIDQRVISVAELIEELNSMDHKLTKEGIVLLGDGITEAQELFYRKLKVPYCIAPPHTKLQRAAAVASLGALYFEKGRTVSASSHAPLYLRKSQAEQGNQKDTKH